MTSLRLFVCQPYGARITPSACAKRYPRQVGRQSAGAGPRADRVHCHECPVGAAHARGEDAPGVEYSLVEVDAPAPPRKPVTPAVASSWGSDMASGMPAPQTGNALGSNAGSTKGVTARRDEHSTTTEDPMPEPETPAPKRAAKKCARAGCDAWFTPTGPRSLYCEQHRQAKERMRAMRERRKALEDADRWVAAAELDESWTKDRPLDQAVQMKVRAMGERIQRAYRAAGMTRTEFARRVGVRPNTIWRYEQGQSRPRPDTLAKIAEVTEQSLEWLVMGQDRPALPEIPLDAAFERGRAALSDAHASAARADEAMRELREVRTTVIERGERIEVLQRELSTAEARIASFVRAEDRLQAAMLGLIEVHLACRDDLDEEETAAMFDALDAGKLTRLARELADYIRSLREAPKAEKPRTFVEAFVEAITPPPGVSAAAVLRAVGYQVVTVDSPRGPVIVVEGAGG